MFEGLHTALITPFRDGKIDFKAFEKVIEHQIAGGVDGIVPMGTTGESPTLSYEEHIEVIRQAVAIAGGRVKVIAGTGANSTREATYLTSEAEKIGVDAVMLVNPYYNKPTQQGLIAHFETIAKSVSVPVVIYNIPGRTGINFLPESLGELCERAENVKVVKEASGSIAQMMRVIEVCGHGLTLLSGDDNLLLPVLSIGGKGVISVLANLIPAEVKKVITLYMEGKVEESRKQFYKILPLCRAMFYETNPIPVKEAMHMAGFCGPELRLPMTRLSDEYRERLESDLKGYGIV